MLAPLLLSLLGLAFAAQALAAPLPPPAPAKTALPAPIYEASALARMPDGRMLVGDNEIERTLFLFEPGFMGPPKPLPLPKKIDDIEAIAVSGDRVVIFGSHSKKKFKPSRGCRTDRGRLALIEGVYRDGDIIWGARKKRDACRWNQTPHKDETCPPEPAALLDQATCEATLVTGGFEATRLCAVLVAAERGAMMGSASCQRAFNLEGAVAIGDRVWVGLRAPTDKGALLLRLADPLGHIEGLRFDAVARIVLPAGVGVRELTSKGEHIYLVAGLEVDGSKAFTLYRFAAKALVDSAHIEPERLPTPLLESAEGVAFGPEGLWMVTDGDEKTRAPAWFGRVHVPE